MPPAASEHDETQLLCSLSRLLQTNVAMETMQKVDQHDEAMEQQAQNLIKKMRAQLSR